VRARRSAVPAPSTARSSAGIVDVFTGTAPLVPPVPAGVLSADEACALTERIRATARDIHDRVERLRQLVDQARSGDAWAVLGFVSWPAYLADALKPMRLPRSECREVVGLLTGEGMSTRAIAPIVGADQKTVSNDRRSLALVAGEESSSPAGVTGLDGKAYPAPRPRLVIVPAPARPVDPARAVAADALRAVRSLRPTASAAITLHLAADVAARAAATALLGAPDVARAIVDARAFDLLELRATRAEDEQGTPARATR
jgi:hypothetical protein